MSQLTLPQRVTLEITAKGWTWKVLGQDGNTIVEHVMNMESRGSARGEGKGDIFDRVRACRDHDLPRGLSGDPTDARARGPRVD